MNELTVFKNEQFGQVRTITRDGEPWFVANDVCRVLEINNSHMALKRLDADEKSGVNTIDPHGREQKTNIINEAGLYSLILTSRKPEAKAFKRWITHDVIPAIRKTGSYNAQPTNAITIDPNVLAMIVGECMKQMIPYIQRPIEVQTETTVRAIEAPVEAPVDTVIKRKGRWPTHEPRKNGIGARYPDYGQRLTKQMMKRNVDDSWLASQINVSKQTIYTWRTGVNFPTSTNYIKVNVALKWRGY